MTYKHGAYGVTGAALADAVVNSETIIVCIGSTTSGTAGAFNVCYSLADYKTKFGWTGKAISGGKYVYAYSNEMSAEYLFDTCNLSKVVFFTTGQDFNDADEVVTKATRGTNFLADLYTEKHLIADFVLMPINDLTDSTSNAAILANLSNFSGQWNALYLHNLPLTGTPTVISSIVASKPVSVSAKEALFYGGKVENGDLTATGAEIPAALIYAGEQAKLDAINNSIPFEIASNKKLENAVSLFPKTWDRDEANALNEVGINTCVYNEGLRTWGGYLAPYNQTSVQPDEIFISTQRMLEYIKRQFIKKNGEKIDSGFTRQKKDAILVSTQADLDVLVARGALIGSPSVSFIEAENSTNDIMQGQFVFTATCTPSVPMVSATLSVAYSDSGFSVFFE